MRRTKNQKGFTIMELLIVIVIIGILIAIAVPAYQNFRDRARLTACQANRRTIKSAYGLWLADGNTGVAMDAAALTANLTTHMGTVPTCPAGGAYAATAAGVITCTFATGTAPHNAAGI